MKKVRELPVKTPGGEFVAWSLPLGICDVSLVAGNSIFMSYGQESKKLVSPVCRRAGVQWLRIRSVTGFIREHKPLDSRLKHSGTTEGGKAPSGSWAYREDGGWSPRHVTRRSPNNRLPIASPLLGPNSPPDVLAGKFPAGGFSGKFTAACTTLQFSGRHTSPILTPGCQ